MPGLTLSEAAELTGLPVDEIERRCSTYIERGLGAPHTRVLPYMLKGLGKITYDAAPETKQELAISRLIGYLRERPDNPQTVGDLSGASRLNRPATEVVLATLRVLGLIEKLKAPKQSGKRIFWRWLGDRA